MSMEKRTDHYIPLFSHSSDPFAALILNDQVFIFDSTAEFGIPSPERAFSILYDLYTDARISDLLPPAFFPYVNNFKETILGEYPLIGSRDIEDGLIDYQDVHYMSLDGNMHIKEENGNYYASFENIEFHNKLFDFNVELSIMDLFLTLMNILVERVYFLYDAGTISKLEVQLKNALLERSKYKSTLRRQISSYNQFEILSTLVPQYLRWVKNGLDSLEISPLQLLKQSGVATIYLLRKFKPCYEFIKKATEELFTISVEKEQAKTVMYYTLARCLKSSNESRFPRINYFFHLPKSDKIQREIKPLYSMYGRDDKSRKNSNNLLFKI